MKLIRLALRISAVFIIIGGWLLLTPLPALGIPAKPVIYQVSAGDSLYQIAKKFATTVAALKTINSIQADWIVPGEIFVIPDQKSDSYIVQPGDYLYAIAQNHQVTVPDLMAENNLQATLLMPGQALTIPEKSAQIAENQTLSDYLAKNGQNSLPGLQIIVHKNNHLLSLYQDNRLIKSYPVALGDGGPDATQILGDHKTPEGYFYIVQKEPLTPADPFLGTRWMRLGYPNINDAVRGIGQNDIDPLNYETIVNAFGQQAIPPQETALGGGVGIHGGNGGDNTGDWTWGCIGLANRDIEDFYDYTPQGTPVIIVK